MPSTPGKKNLLLSILFFGFFILLRLFIIGDASKFIAAGSDFFTPSEWSDDISIQSGQGYDGQFFYHYAISPFETKIQQGVTVDLPPYRHQRIVYPTLAYIFSLGDKPFIPYALIIVNFLAAIGATYFLSLILQTKKILKKGSVIIFLLPGVLMALSRDLSEVVALFFFLASFHFILKGQILFFTTGACLGVLTREPEIILYLPISLWFFINSSKTWTKKIVVFTPVLLLIIWKTIIKTLYPQFESPTHNFTFPFLGIYNGFIQNIHITTFKDVLELGTWLLHLTLIFTCFYLSIKNIVKTKSLITSPFSFVIIGGVLFSLFFSEAIYIDDWAFVRILTTTFCLCLIYLFSIKKIPQSLLLLLLLNTSITFLRLIIRI